MLALVLQGALHLGVLHFDGIFLRLDQKDFFVDHPFHVLRDRLFRGTEQIGHVLIAQYVLIRLGK